MQQSSSENEQCYSTDQQYFFDLCRQGDKTQVHDFLIGDHIELDWKWCSNSGDNFIHMLSANNHVQLFHNEIQKYVLQKFTPQFKLAIFNHQNFAGNTPLHYAVIAGSVQMIKQLLKNQVNTNLFNQFGRTPLMEAQFIDSYHIAEILAPMTKINLKQLKQEINGLEVCNQDSDSQQQSPNNEQIPKKQFSQKNQQKQNSTSPQQVKKQKNSEQVINIEQVSMDEQ